jgi:hypothetical protein
MTETLSIFLFGSLPPFGGLIFLIVGFIALVTGLIIDPVFLEGSRYYKHRKYKRILTTCGFIGLMLGLISVLFSIVI